MRGMVVIGGMAMLGVSVGGALAQDFNFDTQQFGSFGTGSLESFDNGMTQGLKFSFTANDPGCCSGLAVPGFAFGFAGSVDTSTLGLNNQDPSPVDFTGTDSIAGLPQPFNSGTVTKDDFNFFATNDPNGQNFNQSGDSIGAGGMDMFVITGVTDPNLVENVGVRIQSLPGNVNEGSLFLVGDEEPATPNGNGNV